MIKISIINLFIVLTLASSCVSPEDPVVNFKSNKCVCGFTLKNNYIVIEHIQSHAPGCKNILKE